MTAAVNSTQAPTEQKLKNKSGKNIYFLLAFFLIFIALVLYIFKPEPTPLQKGVSKKVEVPFFLAIDGPKAETAAVDGEILVEGRTLPNTTVVIYTNTDETSLQSDSRGGFKDTVIVGDEGGLVRITAFSDNGEEISKTVEVENIDVLGKSDKASGKNSENNTRGNSENNSNKEENNNKTGSGNQKQENRTLNQNRIQNLVEDTKIRPISNDKSSRPVNVSEFLENKVKIEKLTKLGVGRIIDILSRESTKEASLEKNLKLKKMEAKQATAGAALKRHAVSGVIVNVSGGVITLAHQIQEERTYTIYINNGTQISMKGNNSSSSASLSSGLTAGMRIAVVGIPIDSGLLATRIHVIPGKAVGVFKRQPVSSASATPTIIETPTVIPITPSTTINP